MTKEDIRLVCAFVGHGCSGQGHMAGQLDSRRGVMRERTLPIGDRLYELIEMRVIGEPLENGVDRVNHRLGRAAADVERGRSQSGNLAIECVKDLRHAAAPAIDGLLGISDAKERAAASARDTLRQ